MRLLPFLIVLRFSSGTWTKLLWKSEVIIKPNHIITRIHSGWLSHRMFHGGVSQSVLARAAPAAAASTPDEIPPTASDATSRVGARSSGRPFWSRPSTNSAYARTRSSLYTPFVCT